uniref:Uncharacterized protein n=1 Tax=Cannabis sativa TaxID=3483 RepID=A0A803QEN1_CANSA
MEWVFLLLLLFRFWVFRVYFLGQGLGFRGLPVLAIWSLRWVSVVLDQASWVWIWWPLVVGEGQIYIFWVWFRHSGVLAAWCWWLTIGVLLWSERRALFIHGIVFCLASFWNVGDSQLTQRIILVCDRDGVGSTMGATRWASPNGTESLVTESQLNVVLAVISVLSKCQDCTDLVLNPLVLEFFRYIRTSFDKSFWLQAFGTDVIASFLAEFLRYICKAAESSLDFATEIDHELIGESGLGERSIPGNTVAVQDYMPFSGLTTFRITFLSKFECSQMLHPCRLNHADLENSQITTIM